MALRGALSSTSLLNVVLLAHALGPAGRGEYFLFVAGVAVATRLADAGMSPAAVVFVGRYPQASADIHALLVRLLIAISVLAAVVGSAALLLARGVLDQPILALFLLPLTLYEQVWVHLMVGARRIMAMNLVQVCSGLLTVALNVLLVVLRPGGVSTAIGIFAAVALLKVCLMLAVSRTMLRAGPARAHGASLMREMVVFGLRGYPNSVAALLWTRLPAFVLGALRGPAAVGIFSVGQQVQEQLLLPVQAIQDAIYQTVTRLPRGTATLAMNRYLRLGIWGMLPIVLACGIGAPWLVPLVFGADFADTAVVLDILLISAAASVVPGLLSPYFFGQLDRPGLVSLMAWARVLAALGLSVLLARPFGEVGVAVSLVASDIALSALVLMLYVRFARTAIAAVLVPEAADVRLLIGRAAAVAGRRRESPL